MSEEDPYGVPAAIPAPAEPPRKHWWFAALLSLAVCGLGQVYRGQWRRGVALYLLQWPMALMASYAMVSAGPFLWPVLLLALWLLVRLFAIGDAIAGSGHPPLPVQRRPYDHWYVWLAACVALYLLSVWGMRVANQSKAKSFYIPSAAMENTLIPGDALYAKT